MRTGKGVAFTPVIENFVVFLQARNRNDNDEMWQQLALGVEC